MKNIIEITKDELLEKIKNCSINDPWHFHFLTPDCVFNSHYEYKIILETEKGNFYTLFKEKPLPLLEKIESYFYKRS